MRVGEGSYFFKIRQWLLNRKARKCFGSFGKGSEFRPGAYAAYSENTFIGKNVVIRPGCRLFADAKAGIRIGNAVLLGHSVHIYTNNHTVGGYERDPVILEDGCWIGANSVILKGVTIGEDAVVGAGSVVTKNVPAGETWAGNPARCIKRRQKNVTRQKVSVHNSSEGRKLFKRQKYS